MVQDDQVRGQECSEGPAQAAEPERPDSSSPRSLSEDSFLETKTATQ